MKDWKKMKSINCGGNNGSAVYGLGFVGALVYFLQHSTGFMDAILGVVKAVLWPGFLIYRVLELLKM